MKKTLYTVIAFTALSLSLGSCVKDLDTLPLSDTEIVEDKVWATWENYPQVLAKVYGIPNFTRTKGWEIKIS